MRKRSVHQALRVIKDHARACDVLPNAKRGAIYQSSLTFRESRQDSSARLDSEYRARIPATVTTKRSRKRVVDERSQAASVASVLIRQFVSSTVFNAQATGAGMAVE